MVMLTKILAHHYTTDWNLDSFANIDFVANVDSSWPLIVSTRSGMISTDQINRDLFELRRRRGRPSELRNSTTDSLVSAVAKLLNSRGLVTNIAAECSGTLHAMHIATAISQAHRSPCVVFVADNMLDDQFQMWRFASLGALDQDSGRAFDRTSTGFRMGRGMAMFVVADSSVTVSWPTQATVSNYNFFTNPNLLANPGEAKHIADLVQNIDFDSVDFWNAHATGTPVGDQFEYDLFSTLIKKDAPIVGYKSYVGHCISASSGIELCMSLEDRAHGTLRPNIIHGSTVAADDRIITKSVAFPGSRMIKANFGFGGKTVICQVDFE